MVAHIQGAGLTKAVSFYERELRIAAELQDEKGLRPVGGEVRATILTSLSVVTFKGILHQKNFYCLNLIFWIVMGCGIARFGRRGLKTTET